MKKAKSIVIGIAGGTGSGKSTFSHELVSRLPTDRIAYISHDSYYLDLGHLPFEERVKLNFDHPDSLDNELFVSHLKKLRDGEPVNIPVYDFKTFTRTHQVEQVAPQPVILVEGILIFAIQEVRDQLDFKIFVDTDVDIRFMRRLKRDLEERGRTIESVYEQYLREVKPMHDAFVEPSKRYADIVIPHGGKNVAALDMVAAKIRDHLSE